MIYATVTGNATEPKQKTVGGQELLEFSVASNEKRKGEQTTTWVRCAIWGKRATALAQYITKGTPLTVIGSLSMREFDGKNGKQSSLELNVTDVALQGGKRDGNGPVPARGGSSSPGGGGFADEDYAMPEEPPF